jgi:hypothetical protein
MEKTPYLKTDLPDNGKVLAGKLDSKLSYLDRIKLAVANGDDRQVYELLDSKKYNLQIKKTPHAGSNRVLSVMIDDLQDEISHHLAENLIAYLAEKFPFFFYEESELGVFQLYFGNWWDRRHFGVLDPLSVSFIFDDQEYEKLAKAVELAEAGQRYHSQVIADTTRANEELQRILTEQDTRDAERVQLRSQLAQLDERGGLFGGRQNNEQKEMLLARVAQLDAADTKAKQVPSLIAENNAAILNYSKEDTILIYEQKAISDTFETFTAFQEAAAHLYESYVSSLAGLPDPTVNEPAPEEAPIVVVPDDIDEEVNHD